MSGRHIPSTAPVAARAPAQGRYINKVGGSRDDCTPPCTAQCWIEVFKEHCRGDSYLLAPVAIPALAQVVR